MDLDIPFSLILVTELLQEMHGRYIDIYMYCTVLLAMQVQLIMLKYENYALVLHKKATIS